MKSLSQFIVEDKFDNYILNDYENLYKCYTNLVFNFIYEELSQLDNFKEIFTLVYKFIKKNIKDNFDNNQQYTINVSKANGFFKYVILKLIHDKGLYASYDKSISNGEKIYIELHLPNNWEELTFNIGGLFMHELLHAYEDIQRKQNNKPSIFDEIGLEYRNAMFNINHPNENVKQFAVLKYFFNPKERRAYISTLELDIDKVVKNSKASIVNFKPSEILQKLKKDTIWKKYFEFGKFVASINNIEDKDLVNAYYHITKEKKSVNEIKEESKNIFEKFNKKFSVVFLKVLGKYIQQNLENKYISFV